jgi:CBS domain-containing protein
VAILLEKEMNPDVTRIHPDKTVKFAGQILKAVNIGCMVVVDDAGKILGILTERDIVQKVVADGYDPNTTPVKTIMSKNVITMDKKKTVEEAIDLMNEKNVKKIPIVDRGKLVGIVTMTDLMKTLRKAEASGAKKAKKG